MTCPNRMDIADPYRSVFSKKDGTICVMLVVGLNSVRSEQRGSLGLGHSFAVTYLLATAISVK